MNSFNHYAYGAVGEWLYGSVAGIDHGAPGFKRINIRPHLGDLTHARATFHSMYGQIVSAWRMEDGERFTLEVEIPPNTSAEVSVPVAAEGAAVTEGGIPVAEAEGVRFVRHDGAARAAVYAVGAGRYRFETGG